MKRALQVIAFLVYSLSFSYAQSWSAVSGNIKGSFTQLYNCNNKLYANGVDSLNDQAVKLVYWDGSAWHRADSGLDGNVTAMISFKGKLYAGITEKAGANAIYRLMYWNDTLWHRVSTLNGPINSFAIYKGSLVAGGKFTMADTTRAKFIALWNDTTWLNLGRGLSNNVRALAVYKNRIYAGGQFSEVDRWNGKSWEMVLGNKSIRIDGWVQRFCIYNDELYTCGEFNYLAKWNDQDWAPVGSLNDGAAALAACEECIYIGGNFTSSPNGEYSYHIACYKASTMSWSCLGGVLYSGGDCKPYSGTVWALAEYKGEVYVGGQFMIAGGKVISNIARFTPKKAQ